MYDTLNGNRIVFIVKILRVSIFDNLALTTLSLNYRARKGEYMYGTPKLDPIQQNLRGLSENGESSQNNRITFNRRRELLSASRFL